MEPTQTKKGNGALVGSIIVILILVLGGIYLMKNNIQKSNTEIDESQLETLTPGDEVSDIEADLDTISDIDSLDQGLE